MTLIEKIDKELRRLGITQKDFEARALISQNRMSKWKSGQGEPTAGQLLRISRLLNLPMEYLADDEADSTYPPSAGTAGLAEDERTVLAVYRALRLTQDDAIRGLSLVANQSGGTSGDPKQD